MDRGWCAECGRASLTDPCTDCASRVDVLDDNVKPRGRGALGLVLALVLVGGALWWWTSTGDPDPADPTRVGQTSAPEPGLRTCWDSSTVTGGLTCPPLRGRDALFAAFPIDPSTCADDPGRVNVYNRWSLWCDLGDFDVHLAAYSDPDARAQRIGEYGPCRKTGGGRVVCQPNATNSRTVRTYTEASGVLVYMSIGKIEDIDPFLDLPQTPVSALTNGTPAS